MSYDECIEAAVHMATMYEDKNLTAKAQDVAALLAVVKAARELERTIGGVEIHGISTKGEARAKAVVTAKARVQETLAKVEAP
jgi:hypothetical protein